MTDLDIIIYPMAMAKMIKGSKRYVFMRGKDEQGESVVIDILNKKQLTEAMKNGRILETDNVVQVEVLGKINLKKSK